MNPIDYEGEYTIDALLTFLSENRVPNNFNSLDQEEEGDTSDIRSEYLQNNKTHSSSAHSEL